MTRTRERLPHMRLRRRRSSAEERRAREQLWQREHHRLRRFETAKANFDLGILDDEEKAALDGWHIDRHEQDLMPEGPGEPWENGSWAAAREVLAHYSFPPPDLITGLFVPGCEVDGRLMLLRGQFLGVKFWFGVRVCNLVDGLIVNEDGQEVRVWGYSYRTLEGHYEMGQIDFSVEKVLATGRVSFKIHAVSKTGRINNIFHRVGFALFGRYLQRRFATESMRRLKAQVGEILWTNSTAALATEAPPEVSAREVAEER